MKIATIVKGSAAALLATAGLATSRAQAQYPYNPVPGYVAPGAYIPAPDYGPGEVIYGQGIAPHRVVSPAERRGIVEGELYEEYGILPNHPLSPAEQRGFGEGVQVDEGYGQVRPY